MDIIGRDNPKLSKIPNCLDLSSLAKRQDLNLFEGECDLDSIFQDSPKGNAEPFTLMLNTLVNK